MNVTTRVSVCVNPASQDDHVTAVLPASTATQNASVSVFSSECYC